MEYKAKRPTRKDAKDIINNECEYISNVDFLRAVIYLLDNELNNKEKLLREKTSIIEKQRIEILNLNRRIDKIRVSHLSDIEKEDFLNHIIEMIYED